jgi:hypothetical protein
MLLAQYVVPLSGYATLKLDNQKNGLKGVCVHQEANGEAFNYPVKALVHRVIHICKHGGIQRYYFPLFTSMECGTMSQEKTSVKG